MRMRQILWAIIAAWYLAMTVRASFFESSNSSVKIWNHTWYVGDVHASAWGTITLFVWKYWMKSIVEPKQLVMMPRSLQIIEDDNPENIFDKW